MPKTAKRKVLKKKGRKNFKRKTVRKRVKKGGALYLLYKDFDSYNSDKDNGGPGYQINSTEYILEKQEYDKAWNNYREGLKNRTTSEKVKDGVEDAYNSVSDGFSSLRRGISNRFSRNKKPQLTPEEQQPQSQSY